MKEIPKIIHQTWKHQDLPEDYARYRDTVLRLHPDWQHRLWTDADNHNFIATQHAWFLPTYDSYKHEIERVDAVRYFILYTHGGVYIDLDMECLKPIDALLNDRQVPVFSLLAAPTPQDAVIGNAFMAAPAKHPLFALLTRHLPEVRSRDITHSDIFNNTGPDMLTRFLAGYSALGRYETLDLESICDRATLSQLPALMGYNLEQIRRDKRVYVIHHHTNSWNKQHPAPTTVPNGYELIVGSDIHGCDIDYVEYAVGDYAAIIERCESNPAAVGFNFNGFIKSGDGELKHYPEQGNHWIKDGIKPWVCVKTCWLNAAK